MVTRGYCCSRDLSPLTLCNEYERPNRPLSLTSNKCSTLGNMKCCLQSAATSWMLPFHLTCKVCVRKCLCETHAAEVTAPSSSEENQGISDSHTFQQSQLCIIAERHSVCVCVCKWKGEKVERPTNWQSLTNKRIKRGKLVGKKWNSVKLFIFGQDLAWRKAKFSIPSQRVKWNCGRSRERNHNENIVQ